MNLYLSPREKYATIIYETILERGPTTKWGFGLSPNALDEGKEEFRDYPWKYGNKALICDPYSGTYRFARTRKEIEKNAQWHGKYITTRLGREVKVFRAFVDEHGSTRGVDRLIRTLDWAKFTITDTTESGLYIAK